MEIIMKYQIDHDLHIHTYISGCAGHDPRQSKEAILTYGLVNGFGLLCVCDHIWDEKVTPAYLNEHSWSWLTHGQGFEKARELLPLPQSKACKFLFGIEADMDWQGNIAVSREEFDNFDFINFAVNHLHLTNFTYDPSVESRYGSSAEAFKALYKERLLRLLNMDLPFHKCGLAHFTLGPLKAFALFTDEEYREIFGLVAERGMGVELNFSEELMYSVSTPEDEAILLHPYRIAKEMGCKFYLGGDAHDPECLASRRMWFERMVDLLDLTEDDKFDFVKAHIALV
jgi:histidinol phosphatase-like PHP family hydrolase